jgi:hypothetical protein
MFMRRTAGHNLQAAWLVRFGWGIGGLKFQVASPTKPETKP